MSTIIFDNGTLKQRGFQVRSIICLCCLKTRERLNNSAIIGSCPVCGDTNFMDHLEYVMLKNISIFKYFTIQNWIDHLPGLIDIQADKDNMLIVQFLNRKLDRLKSINPDINNLTRY